MSPPGRPKGESLSAQREGSPMSTPLLRIEALRAWYGQAQILFDVALHVGRGEVVALLGRNGAGKSTLLKTVMGLVDRRAGSVHFLGGEIGRLAPHAIARRGLGYVPEERRIFTELTVMENLAVGRQKPRHWPDGAAAPAFTEQQLFELFPNLAGMTDRPAGRISGGEQQMLTVARTLMGNPLLLLLDEPSEGVAPIIVEQMAAMIERVKAQGVSVLLSEQNLAFAERVCDRVYVIEKGQIRHHGTMAALLADDEIRRTHLAL
jgi:branched-chain amino acid transport system ATP-binding protein